MPIELFNISLQVYSIGLQDQILQMFADQGVIVSTVLLVKLVGGDICQIDLLVQIQYNDRIFSFFQHGIAFFKETWDFFWF